MILDHIMREWKHIFKLDPAKDISDEKIERLCQSNTDALIVCGTANVTYDGVLYLLKKIKQYNRPCILELSTLDDITLELQYYLIPMVMNSTEKKQMMDIQHEANKAYKQIQN